MAKDAKSMAAGKVKIWDMELEIVLGKYIKGGQLHVALVGPEGDPCGDFSTNGKAYGAQLGEDEFCVKTWSENEDMVEPMMGTGLFEDTGRRCHSGYVEVPIWRFKRELLGAVAKRASTTERTSHVG